MTTNESRISKRRVGAIIAAAATFAIVSASAATLGGLNVDRLGAEQGDLEEILTEGVVVTFDTEYAEGAYQVVGATLATLGDELLPQGAEYDVTFYGEARNVLGDASGVVGSDAGSLTLELDAADINARDLEGVAVVINGVPAPVSVED